LGAWSAVIEAVKNALRRTEGNRDSKGNELAKRQAQSRFLPGNLGIGMKSNGDSEGNHKEGSGEQRSG
jgi:hypothetical protein